MKRNELRPLLVRLDRAREAHYRRHVVRDLAALIELAEAGSLRALEAAEQLIHDFDLRPGAKPRRRRR